MQRLPHGLAEMPSILGVISLYKQSFWRFREFPLPKSPSDEERFTEVIKSQNQLIANGNFR